MNEAGYLGNTKLKNVNTRQGFTQQQIEELSKCSDDVIYFTENYIKIRNVDEEGLIPFKLRNYQKDLIQLMDKERFVICKIPRQYGKCLESTTYVRLLNKRMNKDINIPIGLFFLMIKFHNRLPFCLAKLFFNINILYEKCKTFLQTMFQKCFKSLPNQKSATIIRKYINTIFLNDWEIYTDTGWEKLNSVSQTIPYQVYKLKTENGKHLQCADNHILFDENYQEIFAKDCIPFITKIITKNGPELVTEIKNLNYKTKMYDFDVASENHRFWSNDILSHNSSTYVAFTLWYLIFHNHVEVALLANKGQTARELLSRIQVAWENLPLWMQQGIIVWNKGSIELENGSKILATNTASNSIRGYSFSMIILDEFAHIDNNLAEEFFRSTYPAISSGKKTKVIIVSTPKGMNLYYKLWQEADKPAKEKTSMFVPFEVHWTILPGRDEKWKQQEIANLGSELAFDQEYGTFDASTYINIRDKETGEERFITIGELYNENRNEIQAL